MKWPITCILLGMTQFSRCFMAVILLLALGCAKSPGFRAEDFDYQTIDGGPSNGNAQAGTVVRNSNRIQFEPTKATWNQDELTLMAKVKVAGSSLGELEFRGKKKEFKIFLDPVKTDLQGKLKAQVVCTSEGDACGEFFIDVFYNDQSVLYHDQVVSTPKKDEKAVEIPHEVKALKDDFWIQDEISKDEVVQFGFVGTPDEEALAAFQIQPAVKKDSQSPSEGEQISDEVDPNEIVTGAQASPTEKDTRAKPSLLERFRMGNQAIGNPSRGRLVRPTDFMKLSTLPGMFIALKPGEKNYFGTFDLATVVKDLGNYLQKILPGRKLMITEISKFNGGRLSYRIGRRTFYHSSHQNGQDADIRYLRTDEDTDSDVVDRKGRINSHFLPAQQWELFKKAFATNKVDLIFVDAAIKKSMCNQARRTGEYQGGQSGSGVEVLKRLYIVPGHDNHFHIRVRCGKDQPQCEKIQYRPRAVGC